MRFLISLLFLFLLAGVMNPSNTIGPDSDATVGSGREEMMEKMNTTPNPVPEINESEEFQNSTIQKEEAPVDDAQKVPTYEHDGLYRKGL